MSTNMFCFDVSNRWVHVYTINDLLNVGPLPIVGDFVDANATRYTLALVNGKYRLTAAGAAADPSVRLDGVFTNIAAMFAARLASQMLTETERQARLAVATTELAAARVAVGLGPRFTAMQAHQFGHPTVQGAAVVPPQDPASTRGGWLHNLFCH